MIQFSILSSLTGEEEKKYMICIHSQFYGLNQTNISVNVTIFMQVEDKKLSLKCINISMKHSFFHYFKKYQYIMYFLTILQWKKGKQLTEKE